MYLLTVALHGQGFISRVNCSQSSLSSEHQTVLHVLLQHIHPHTLHDFNVLLAALTFELCSDNTDYDFTASQKEEDVFPVK